MAQLQDAVGGMMSVQFTAGGKEFSFSSYSGTVIGEKRLSETHITTTGGGGAIRNGKGNVSAPTVHSKVVTNQDIWLRGDTGNEFVLRLKGCNIPILENQRISVVLFQCGEDSNEILLFNHNTKTWHSLCSQENYVKRYALPLPFWGYSKALACIPGLFLWYITENYIVALIAGAAVYYLLHLKQAPVEQGYKEQYEAALQTIKNEISYMG